MGRADDLIAALEIAVKAAVEGGWRTKDVPARKTPHALAVEKARGALRAALALPPEEWAPRVCPGSGYPQVEILGTNTKCGICGHGVPAPGGICVTHPWPPEEGARDAALEDAVKVCLQRSVVDSCPCEGCVATREAADRIRSLKSAPPSTERTPTPTCANGSSCYAPGGCASPGAAACAGHCINGWIGCVHDGKSVNFIPCQVCNADSAKPISGFHK
jgi:hypothetical protein